MELWDWYRDSLPGGIKAETRPGMMAMNRRVIEARHVQFVMQRNNAQDRDAELQ
jgi:hypothetical protein